MSAPLNLAALAGSLVATLAQGQMRLSAERVHSGSSLFVASPPEDYQRLFTVSQQGAISVIKNGVLLPAPFLGLAVATGGESGLLGLAFHPQFAQNGYTYVYYSTFMGATIARYSLDPANPDRADPASAYIIMKLARGGSVHWGGWIGFGPDGLLYIASGNGGGDPQATASLFGKMLRVDVNGDDFPGEPDRNYSIPQTNPFFGSMNPRPEIWALGLRNPWRCSFDRLSGDLWIGDVGDNREEINFQAAALTPPFVARNYGYSCMDGSTCGLPTSGCPCATPDLALPLLEYRTHVLGNAVIGGYVFRGNSIPELRGWYLFADYSSGRRWRIRRTPTGMDGPETVDIDGLPTALHSFGEDAAGNLYACGPQGVYRLVLCPANCDGSVAPPLLNANDFVCFYNRFASGSALANCDGSTEEPVLTAADFVCFVNQFAAGCS